MKKFLKVIIFISYLLNINFAKEVGASLQNEYKTESKLKSECSWEKSSFERNGSYAIYRYCINSKNEIIYFAKGYESSSNYKGTSPSAPIGIIKKQEIRIDGGTYKTRRIYQYEIEDNELVFYRCDSSSGFNCTGKIKRVILGYKIN